MVRAYGSYIASPYARSSPKRRSLINHQTATLRLMARRVDATVQSCGEFARASGGPVADGVNHLIEILAGGRELIDEMTLIGGPGSTVRRMRPCASSSFKRMV